jgi:hypothetical protein
MSTLEFVFEVLLGAVIGTAGCMLAGIYYPVLIQYIKDQYNKRSKQ